MRGGITNAVNAVAAAAALTNAVAQTPTTDLTRAFPEPNPLVEATMPRPSTVFAANHPEAFVAPAPGAPPKYHSAVEADRLIADIRISENRNGQPVPLEKVRELFGKLDPDPKKGVINGIAHKEVAVGLEVGDPDMLKVYYKTYVDPTGTLNQEKSFTADKMREHLNANRGTILAELTGTSDKALEKQREFFGKLVVEASPLSAPYVRSQLGAPQNISESVVKIGQIIESPVPTDPRERAAHFIAAKDGIKAEFDKLPAGAEKDAIGKQIVAEMKLRGGDLIEAQLKNEIRPSQGLVREKVDRELNLLANSLTPAEKEEHRTNIVAEIKKLVVPSDRVATVEALKKENLYPHQEGNRQFAESLAKYGINVRSLIEEAVATPLPGAAPAAPQPISFRPGQIPDGHRAGAALLRSPTNAVEIINALPAELKTGEELQRIKAALRGTDSGKSFMSELPVADRQAMAPYVFDADAVLAAQKLKSIVDGSGGSIPIIRKEFQELPMGDKRGLSGRREQAVLYYNLLIKDPAAPELDAKVLSRK